MSTSQNPRARVPNHPEKAAAQYARDESLESRVDSALHTRGDQDYLDDITDARWEFIDNFTTPNA